MSAILSIIVPTFNSQNDLPECLASIYSQDFKNFEVLIVDGGSTDGTLAIAQSYEQFGNFNIISERDNGIYDAMNKGILCSKSDWIFFLGSDDVLANDSVLHNVFVNQRDIVEQSDFVYGNVLWGRRQLIYDGRFDIFKLFNQNICHQAIFFKRDLFSRLGLFNLKYPLLADWEFNIRSFGASDVRINYLNIVISCYSIEGTSSRSDDVNFENQKDKLFEDLLKRQRFAKRLKFYATVKSGRSAFELTRNFFAMILFRILISVKSLFKG